jgi:hypothetical protein
MPYRRAMTKKVISFRLSDNDLLALDEACQRFRWNRSQVVSAGIGVLLREYVHKDGTLLRRAPWLMTSLTESASVEN